MSSNKFTSSFQKKKKVSSQKVGWACTKPYDISLSSNQAQRARSCAKKPGGKFKTRQLCVDHCFQKKTPQSSGGLIPPPDTSKKLYLQMQRERMMRNRNRPYYPIASRAVPGVRLPSTNDATAAREEMKASINLIQEKMARSGKDMNMLIEDIDEELIGANADREEMKASINLIQEKMADHGWF